jgi:signal peptidase I
MEKLLSKKEVTLAALLIVMTLIINTVDIIHVVGASMEPTLTDGQEWLGYQSYNGYVAGDIIYFDPPDDSRSYIKRIVATAGSALSLDADGYIILTDSDGHVTVTDWQVPSIYWEDYPLTVDQGYVYVIGDNVNNSRDSRYFGLVPVQSIHGKLTSVKISDNFRVVQKIIQFRTEIAEKVVYALRIVE